MRAVLTAEQKLHALTPGTRIIPGLNFPHFVIHDGEYPPHPNPMYDGNIFIGAIPQYVDDDELLEDLERLPQYGAEQLEQPPAVRLQLVMSLARIFLSLPRTLLFARSCLNILCEGYVGRGPYDVRYHQLLGQQWERRLRLRKIPAHRRGEALAADVPPPVASDSEKRATPREIAEELSAAFLGDAGTGKTKTAKRFTKIFETPIYHAKYDIWQLPVILIRFPPDGRSLHSLATAIITAIDRLLPHLGYAEEYLRKGSSNANSDERLIDAETLMHRHYVGLVFADESQDAKFATDRQLARSADPHADIKPEGGTPVLSLLIAASNRFGIPLILIGTRELHDVLKVRTSRARRAVGYRLEPWGHLARSGDIERPHEFELLLLHLFQYRWTTQPLELTQDIADKFAELAQCNPDLIVKLFIALQMYAIEENPEVIDAALVELVFDLGFEVLEESLRAIAENDPEALLQRPDLAPFELRKTNPDLDAVKAAMLKENMQQKRGRWREKKAL